MHGKPDRHCKFLHRPRDPFKVRDWGRATSSHCRKRKLAGTPLKLRLRWEESIAGWLTFMPGKNAWRWVPTHSVTGNAIVGAPATRWEGLCQTIGSVISPIRTLLFSKVRLSVRLGGRGLQPACLRPTVHERGQLLGARCSTRPSSRAQGSSKQIRASC